MTSKKYSKEVFGNRLKKIARKLTRKNHTQKLKKNKKEHKRTQKGSGAESSKLEAVELENTNVANQEEVPVNENQNAYSPVEPTEEKYDDSNVFLDDIDKTESNELTNQMDKSDEQNDLIKGDGVANENNDDAEDIENENNVDKGDNVDDDNVDNDDNDDKDENDNNEKEDQNDNENNEENESNDNDDNEQKQDNWNYEKVKEVLQMLDNVVTKLNQPFENYKSTKNSMFIMTDKNTEENESEEKQSEEENNKSEEENKSVELEEKGETNESNENTENIADKDIDKSIDLSDDSRNKLDELFTEFTANENM